jgi:hypothetical protein
VGAYETHFVREDTAAERLTRLLLKHPVDADDLVGHEGDFHPRQEGRQIRESQRIQRRFHFRITVKVVRISSDLKVSLDAEGTR